jgi:deoxyribonuclease II
MNSIFKIILLLSILARSILAATISSKYKLTCRDEKGSAVDWFTLYKLPKQSENKFSSRIKDGSGYAYITDKDQTWSLSTQPITSSTSMPGVTLSSFYQTTFAKNNNQGYILYNDQFDGKSLASRAHAKGIIVFDDKSIVWIVHSIPNYPPKQSTGKYGIDDSQLKFGQSLICLSLDISALEQIGRQLLLAFPQIYDSYMPDSLKSLSTSFNLVYSGKRNSARPYSNVETLKTLGKNEFVALHKSTYFANDLYSDLIAKHVKSNLLVESWSNGVGTIESDCVTSFSVNNIDQINFKSYKANFSVHSDHSKWSISLPNTNATMSTEKYVCIGDINRQSSQFKRGGGAVCFKNNLKVWSAYYEIIDQVEPCENDPRKKGATTRAKARRTKQSPKLY